MKKLIYLTLATFCFIFSLTASAHITPTATVTQIDTVIKLNGAIDQ